ncbi:MAG: CRISPR-associated endonuclease Cas1 [Thermodesulfovibrionales bacterium]|nr:CRISPR-associated endonuclease Cas1 [Thermodesulfovibrionales bacterium]
MGFLFKNICNPENLTFAWRYVRKKGSAGGIDGVDIAEFDKASSDYILELSEELATGKYNPEPYYKIDVPKRIGSSEKRTLGLLTIKDKIVQQTVRNVIEPLFEKQFLDVSYGYRPDKGPLKAVKRVRHMITSEKRHWITVCDIDKFFDTLNHEKLFELIEKTIYEKEVLHLLRLWVKMGNVDKDGKWIDRPMGVPQGGILSPLMSNIYLHPFDEYMKKRGHGLVRYSDDFIILSPDDQKARQSLIDAKCFLEDELFLKLNEGYEIRHISKGFVYMGFLFKDNQISIDAEKMQKIKMKIHFTCKNNFHKPVHVFIDKLNDEIDGWRNYYRHLAPEEQIAQIEQYLKQQLGIYFKRKKNAGQIKFKSDVINYAKQIRFISDDALSDESQEFAKQLIDFIWNNKAFKTHTSSNIKDSKLPVDRPSPNIKEPDLNQRSSNNENLKATNIAQNNEDIYSNKTDQKKSMISETQPPKEITVQIPIEQSGLKDSDTVSHDKQAELKVQQKKREYYKKRILTGNLVVTTHNCFLGRRKGRIIVRYQKQVIKEISADKIDHITITAHGVSLSSNLIDLCVKKKIPIDFFNFKGEPTAKLFLPIVPDAKISIAQTEAFFNGKCYHIASQIVEAKITNQMNVIKYFLKSRKSRDEEFRNICNKALEEMGKQKELAENLEHVKDFDLFRNRLMAIEGAASSHYWEVVSKLLEDDVLFVKRERQGAKDLVNSCLNYGYSLLYSRIWQILIQTGLNPMISYLHKEQPNKPTLTYDLIEEFRQMIVDRTIFSMFTKGRELNLTDMGLSSASRQLIVDEVVERIKTETVFRSSKMTYEAIISHQAKALADYLKGEAPTYKPYIGRY